MKIFDGARFGDKFVTSTGNIVILLREFICNGYKYYVSNGRTEWSVDAEWFSKIKQL